MRAASASAKLRGNIGPVSRTSRAKTLPGPRTFQYRDPFSTENLPVLSRFDTHASDCDLRSSTLYCLVIARHSFSLLHRSHQTRRTGKHNPPPPAAPHPHIQIASGIFRYLDTKQPSGPTQPMTVRTVFHQPLLGLDDQQGSKARAGICSLKWHRLCRFALRLTP